VLFISFTEKLPLYRQRGWLNKVSEMKSILFFLLIVGLAAGVVLAARSVTSKTSNSKHKDGSSGFAVVELFTSEGCSSCPPADKLMAKLKDDYKTEPVYILAYHVDYWDRLGWKDSFSKPLFTSRQYQYATWLKLESAYTPQVVINGTRELVGSNEPGLRSAITNNLASAMPLQLKLNSHAGPNGKIVVGFTLSAKAANTSLVINLVERSATTMVLKGENKGRKIDHVQIVFDQVSLPANQSGNTTFELPSGKDRKDFQVIGFIQDNNTGKIIGAAKTDLN
jgi:hypothetical protein